MTAPTQNLPQQRLSSDAVCAFAGVTYRMLDWWIRCGYVPEPARTQQFPREGAPEPRRTTGYLRTWTEADAAHVARLAQLVRAGIQPQIAADALRTAGPDAGSVTLPGGLTVSLLPVPKVAS